MSLSFTQFMHVREKRILAGYMGTDPDPEQVEKRVAYLFDRHHLEINSRSQAQGRLDPSDPFAARRALSHYRAGIADLTDYDGEVKTRECKTCEGTGRINGPTARLEEREPCEDCEGKGNHVFHINVRHP